MHHIPIDSSLLFIGVPPPREPRLLIPLASPRVQTLSFGLYSPGSSRGKLFKWFGRVAAGVGLMKVAGRFLAAPINSFKATETVKPILDGAVFGALQSDWEVLLGKGPVSFALSLGESNHYRKVTALVFDKRAAPLAFAKVACTTQAISLISNEVVALEKMSMLKCQSVVMPFLLGKGKTDTASWILQSPLLSGRTSRNVLQNAHIAFLSELAQKSIQVIHLNSSDIWKYLQVILKRPVLPIKAGFESERSFVQYLCERLKALDAGDVQMSWPFTVSHGDFAPWNMRLIDGKAALYDWEYFMPLAPAGWDILYFIFRVENLIKRQSLEQIWSKFESGAYLESLELWEKQAGIQVPDRRLLVMFVLISIALDLVPKWICRENDP